MCARNRCADGLCGKRRASSRRETLRGRNGVFRPSESPRSVVAAIKITDVSSSVRLGLHRRRCNVWSARILRARVGVKIILMSISSRKKQKTLEVFLTVVFDVLLRSENPQSDSKRSTVTSILLRQNGFVSLFIVFLSVFDYYFQRERFGLIYGH